MSEHPSTHAATGPGTGAAAGAQDEVLRRQLLVTARRAHWRRARRLTGVLLLAWFGTTFCTVFFARELAALSLFGWPLSFYLAAQGAALAYLAILAVYALAMARIDRRFARALGRDT